VPSREPEPEPERGARPAPARVEGPGGWIAEGDLSPEPGSLRMSLEQANRDPEAFFAAAEPRRVYVPTDDIFATGSADLVRGGDLELARLANLLKLHPERPVVIEVHNDAAAGDTQRWLSQRRADAVRTWLIHRGHLAAEQLRFELRGGDVPLVPADGSYAERRPNRRLELRLAERER
jgi:outer membrane protein OmpA-like peptidoglycan-associated protein